MVEVTPRKLKEHLKHDLNQPFPIYIWGAPGVGKSSIVAEVSKELGLQLVLLSVALEHPYTLGGLPVVLWREKSVAKLPPSYLRGLKNAVLFLDDFAASDPAQQRVALTLTTYRRVGDYDLDESVRIVFASNRVEDNSFIIRPSMAVLNRVKHYTLVPSLDDWFIFVSERCAPLHEVTKFGEKVWDALFPYIVVYLKTQPKKFFTDASKNVDSVTYPTPRSWFHALCDLSLYAKEGKIHLPLNEGEEDIARVVVSGWVGADAAHYFIPMLKVDPNSVDEFIAAPHKLEKEMAHTQAIYALLMLHRGVPAETILPYIRPENAALITFLVKHATFLRKEDLVKFTIASLTTPKKRGKKGK